MPITPPAAAEEQESPELQELRNVLLKSGPLVDKISPVIADILEEQIKNSGDEIAQAIAPVIGEALRRQIYTAREDIIDALYPVIGQTINRAMTEALRDIARNVDRRVRQSVSPQTVIKRWHARAQGVSRSDYALREAMPFRVREIFLIHRESGLLIHHLTSDLERPPDRDLVSGMLTAIRDFAREALGDEESGELDAIAYEMQNILLEAGGAAFFRRSGGCNYAVGSKYLMLIRNRSVAYFDVADHKEYSLRDIRSGCSNSLIAADGLLNVPCFAYGCVCNYPMQTSFSMRYLPEMANWAGK